MSIFLEPTLEIYITNECNLSCSNCNRFNNHDFQGHYYWEDYAEDFEKWSSRINAKFLTIIGGEPSLNPGLETWTKNLRRLWPKTTIMIQSNGIGSVYKNRIPWWDKYQVSWAVSLHDLSMSPKLLQNWNSVGQSFAGMISAYEFTPATVQPTASGFRVHDSDPNRAFDVCNMRTSHTMFQGKLYKCPITALLPIFCQQHNVEMTDQQQQLINQYQPLSADCSEEELQKFAADRNTPISQCNLCPEKNAFSKVVLGPRPTKSKVSKI
jgi:hypothetical protein